MPRCPSRAPRFLTLLALSIPVAACSQNTGWDAGDTGTDLGSDVVDATPDAIDAIDVTDAAVDVRPDVQYDVQFADVQRDVATDVTIAPTHEYVYVMSALSVDPDDNVAMPHTGFDVDGLVSPDTDPMGCYHPDFGSAIDPDQNSPTGCLFGTPGCNGAVDNQLPVMANSIRDATGSSGTPIDVRAELTNAIDQNFLVLLLRLTRVDSFADDDDVGVYVYRGFPNFGTSCTTVQAGREYQVDASSLTSTSGTLEDAAFRSTARIVHGRLQFAAPDGFVFTLQGRGLLPISLHSMRMRGDIAPDGIVNGNLGGWDTGQNLVDQFDMLAPSYMAIIPTLVGGFVDIQIDGICHTSGSTPRLGGVSLGAGFQALPATISSTMPIVTSPSPGTCLNP